MVVGFKFRNYLSYRDEADFTMIAQKSEFNSRSITSVELKGGETIRLVNTGAIFGANASGKSNVIRVLRDLSGVVRDSLTYKRNHPIPLRKPFNFDSECENLPTSISVDFIVEGERFVYEVSANDYGVVKEKLIRICRDLIEIILNRNADNKELNINISQDCETSSLDRRKTTVLPNQLLLSWFLNKKKHTLQRIAVYLAKLDIHMADPVSSDTSSIRSIIQKYLDGGKVTLFHRFVKLIRKADMGIIDVVIKRPDEEDFVVQENCSLSQSPLGNDNEQTHWDLLLLHQNYCAKEKRIVLRLSQESEGTRSLIFK